MSTIKVDTLQTRSGSTAAVTGAGFVATDQIRGNTAANSVTVVAEGGTNTTNLQQGLAKAWLQANNAAALSDSFNIASGTDDGTGTYSYGLTANMGNIQWSMTTNALAAEISQVRSVTLLTNIIRNHVFGRADSFSAQDQVNFVTLHGDLA
jgi:hypothetical protein